MSRKTRARIMTFRCRIRRPGKANPGEQSYIMLSLTLATLPHLIRSLRPATSNTLCGLCSAHGDSPASTHSWAGQLWLLGWLPSPRGCCQAGPQHHHPPPGGKVKVVELAGAYGHVQPIGQSGWVLSLAWWTRVVGFVQGCTSGPQHSTPVISLTWREKSWWW